MVQIVRRDLQKERVKWSLQNKQGFNFLLLDDIISYVVLPTENDNILLGNMQGDWHLTPYEKVVLDYEQIEKQLSGKWAFSINHPNGRRVVRTRFKKDGSGTWHSLNKKEKVPITWRLRSGAPILHIRQSANRQVDYLLLSTSKTELVLEELNTQEYP